MALASVIVLLQGEPTLTRPLGRKAALAEGEQSGLAEDASLEISGVSFDEPLLGARTFDLEGHAIPYIGKAALIANKKAAGRLKDLADVEELERLRER